MSTTSMATLGPTRVAAAMPCLDAIRSKFVAICCALLPAPQTTSGKSALTAESSGCWAGGMEFNWTAASSGERAPLATSWRRSMSALAVVAFVPFKAPGRNENKIED